ncbi:dynamin family protein [Actinocorallia sp. API 0066]|uniref:dynamin family protein n=1 Tax=Actinocorallia sp. API 0066 TaxID=2896846 RepID=UPI001E636E18|nr:dynamin family protein [Actinocorallia sp. API 0066]MCD0451271.1 dynamin family protein [Actinocorallia sp. API 0066]
MSADRIEDVLAAVADAAGRMGLAGTADPVRAELAGLPDGAARVVVVGEKKRGKSSLLNALLGRPGLLPVDADLATSTYIAVGYGDQEGAVAVDAQGERVETGLSGIAEYAALDPVTAQAAHPDVTHVEVTVRSETLARGLVLYDTPGVGGLVAGHGAVTLAALDRADAVLFVVSGTSELTASECAFLHRATDRVATVLFVLTQTDKYPSWRAVLDRNLALVAEHAPRLAKAPWYAVSSRFRLDAIRTGDAARAEASGFGPLEAALIEGVAGRITALRRANAARTAALVLNRLAGERRRGLLALAGDPALLKEITADRDALTALGREDAAWRTRLAREFAALDQELMRLYQRLITDVQTAAEELIAETDPEDAEEAVREIETGLRAVWARMETAAGRGADRIAFGLAADLAADGVDALTLHVVRPPGVDDLGAPRWSGQDERGGALFTAVERYLPGMGVAFMIGNVLTLSPLVLFGIGGLIGHGIHSQRRLREERARTRADLTRHLHALIRRLNQEVPAELKNGIARMLEEVRDAVAARLAARRAELERTLTERAETLKAAETERAPRRAALKADVAALEALAARLAAAR